MKYKIDILRERALHLCSEYEAIRVLTNFTKNLFEELEIVKNTIQTVNKKELEELIQDIKRRNSELSTHFGCKVSFSKLIQYHQKIIKEASEIKESFPLLPKFFLESIFSNYNRVVPNFDRLPRHASIGLDIKGEFIDNGIEIYLLETVLYENMCTLFNQAHKYNQHMIKWRSSTKVEVKTAASLNRATILAAMNFLESYLNGIAFDYTYSNSEIDEKDLMLLTEWDYSKEKEKYVSLRDKILYYPKIIGKKAHPPLQESNCPEIEYILKKSKSIRDSVVHASPHFDKASSFPMKQQYVFRISFNDVELTVDNVIAVVRKIEIAIFGNDERIPWLFSRGEDKQFADSVFA